MCISEKKPTMSSATISLGYSRKDQQAAQREYKRKKSQKKAQRLKQLEEEREQEKNKWLDFNAKVSFQLPYST